MVRVGVIGCGQWGPNYIRVFSQIPKSSVPICADRDPKRLEAVAALYPRLKTTKNHQDIIKDPEVDAVCIATPTNTHYSIAKEALQAGKHVLCEKPLCLEAAECEELRKLAQKKRKALMVGHVFLFNPGIRKVKEYIQSGELGKIYYAYSTRTNLGPFRYDVNALWDLAPHDIAIFNYLFDGTPVNVSARGQKSLGTKLEDLAFATLEYPKNIVVNIHVSWLDPKKVRQITIVGEKKMVVWDDLNPEGPIKLYDKHVEKINTYYETYSEFKLLSSEGSITVPKIATSEPLKLQAEYFINSIMADTPVDLVDASKGRDVVKVLSCVQASIDKKGASVAVK